MPDRAPGTFSRSDSPAAPRGQPGGDPAPRPGASAASSEAAAPLRRHGAAGRRVDARHVGVPRHRDHVLRRPVHGCYLVYRHASPEGFAGGQPSSERHLGRRQHDRAHRQLADDGARGAGGADQRAAPQRRSPGLARRWFSGPRSSGSRRSSTPTSSRITSFPGRTSTGKASIRRPRRCSTRCTSA